MAVMNGTLAITGKAESDGLLNSDPLALLIGMLLDQQVPMEWAFASPYTLRERLGGVLDASTIASMDPDKFLELFKGPPALHRFPGSMGKRTQAMCQTIVDDYGGDAERVWSDAKTGAELFSRLRALPGYGEEKARIFTALLAKRFGVKPRGWKEFAGPFADSTPRSVADVHSPASLAKVRAFKQEKKKQGKTKQD
jgi:uncharacterized HhH-GPD family protein